jgi:hypothetical protein
MPSVTISIQTRRIIITIGTGSDAVVVIVPKPVLISSLIAELPELGTINRKHRCRYKSCLPKAMSTATAEAVSIKAQPAA